MGGLVFLLALIAGVALLGCAVDAHADTDGDPAHATACLLSVLVPFAGTLPRLRPVDRVLAPVAAARLPFRLAPASPPPEPRA